MAMTYQVKSLLLLCLVLTGTLVLSKATSEPGNVSQIFENWLEEHGRTYKSSEEKAKRFFLFKENLEHIESFNRGNHSSTLGLNSFSDMTFEEFQEKYGCTFDIPEMDPTSISSTFRYQNFKDEDLPESWDWRTQGAVTNVKKQGNCGGCWAFATAAAVEGLTPFYNKPYGKLMNLSVQQLIACSKPYGTNGCDNGTVNGAFEYVKDNGLVTEEKFPYRGADDQSCASRSGYFHDPDIRISGYQFVPMFDEVALAKAVYHHPVVVLHSVSNRFVRHRRGIFMDADGECAKRNLSHSSTLVGFGTTPFGEDYWILKNSWGTSWGEHGFGLINRNSKSKLGTCNLATAAMYGTL